MPKPPPTSCVSTRIAVSGTLNTPSASSLRTTATPCVEAISVYFCFASSHMPMPERGSSETGRKARVVEPHAFDVGRACEGGIRGGCVPVGPVERDVAGPPFVDRDSAAGGRAQHIGGGREFFEIDRHLLGCIERLRQRLRHHDRDALTDIADAIDRERRHRGREHRLAVPAGKDRDRRDRAEAVIREIAAGEDAEHARHSARVRHVHAADRRMTDGRPHEHRIGLARRVEVVGEAALAGEQRLVLAAQRAVITAKARGCAVHQISPDEVAVLRNATLAACG